MRSRSLWALAVVGVLLMTLTATYAAQQQQMVLEVRLGEKGEDGDKRDNDEHSISMRALQAGQTKFWVKGKDDQVFLVDLAVAEEEIRSFVSGTAMIRDAMPAVKAEGDSDDAVDGWVVEAGAEAPLIVTLQLKRQTAAPAPGMPSNGGGGGGGW